MQSAIRQLMKRLRRTWSSSANDAARLRILEARFRPPSRAQLLIARVYCEGADASVEPVASALDGSPVVAQLRQIVEHTGPDPYAELVAFSGAEWSFAEARAGRGG